LVHFVLIWYIFTVLVSCNYNKKSGNPVAVFSKETWGMPKMVVVHFFHRTLYDHSPFTYCCGFYFASFPRLDEIYGKTLLTIFAWKYGQNFVIHLRVNTWAETQSKSNLIKESMYVESNLIMIR
jgi:hypothetical protein